MSTPQTKVVTPELYAALEATARERQLDNLDELIRSDLLQQIAAIERMGPPGIIDSVKQMLIALKEIPGCPRAGCDRRRGDGADHPGPPAPGSQQALSDRGSGHFAARI